MLIKVTTNCSSGFPGRPIVKYIVLCIGFNNKIGSVTNTVASTGYPTRCVRQRHTTGANLTASTWSLCSCHDLCGWWGIVQLAMAGWTLSKRWVSGTEKPAVPHRALFAFIRLYQRASWTLRLVSAVSSAVEKLNSWKRETCFASNRVRSAVNKMF